MERSFWVVPVVPESNGKCPCNSEVGRDLTHSAEKRKNQCDHTVALRVSQELPTATRSWKSTERILPSSLRRGQSPADSLILNFWPPDLGENPVCGYW